MSNSQILVVEDESIVAMEIEDRLKGLGYGVAGIAFSGEEAIRKAAETLPNLVLMDIRLKGDIDGIEAAQQIRNCFDIPVVYLTAYSDKDTLQRAKVTEPFGYMLKPFEERELHTTIEMALYKHEMERKLKESEQWLATTLKSIGDAVIATDIEGSVTFMNPIAEALTGWDQETSIGKDSAEIFNIIDGETHNSIENPVTKVLREDVSANPVSNAVLITKDGTEKNIDANATSIKGEKGDIVGAVLTFRDISERVHAEEKLHQKEEQLRQAMKMEAIGRLAGGIAHDFNNLLTAIIGYSDILLMQVDYDNRIHQNIEEIKKAGESAASLTRQLLAFSRRQVLRPKVLNLNEVVANMERMLQLIIGENTDLATALDPGLGQVKADSGQIEQIILNLVVNSRDAMPEGGKLTVETANADLEENYVHNHVFVQPGPYVMLSVSDNGCGMDEETQSHIFEPFFTTKEKGQGTGLGLSTAYGIVKQSNGYIFVYSEPGQGTTFKIYLPRVEEAVEPSGSRGVPSETPQGSETVLVVENEDVVRGLACQILRGNCYTVLEAQDGKRALQICEDHDGPIHLLVTDVVMPGISGRRLADHLVSLYPKIKVLYTSGYTDDAIVRHGILEPETAFLQKPFTLDTLARKVREVLDTPQEIQQ